MATVLKPGWSKPTTILFASEIPANEKAFAFALAQASEFGADLILFHAYDTLVVAASETSGIRYYDYAAAARTEMKHLEPLAERARAAGLRCEVVVRPGLPADQILAYTREREIDRIVMGTHSPGPIGKLLVGSVAEAVLRTRRSARLHRRSRGGRRQLSPLRHQDHPLRTQPAGHQPRGYRLCRRPGRATQRTADPAARHQAPGHATRFWPGGPLTDIENDLLRWFRRNSRTGSPFRPSWCRAIPPRNCSTSRARSRPI